MAVLYISEYAQVPVEGSGSVVPCGREPVITNQTVAIAGSSAASAPFSNATHFVRLHTDVICSIRFSLNGTAVAALTDARMAAGQTEFFGVTPGMNVAVILNT